MIRELGDLSTSELRDYFVVRDGVRVGRLEERLLVLQAMEPPLPGARGRAAELRARRALAELELERRRALEGP